MKHNLALLAIEAISILLIAIFIDMGNLNKGRVQLFKIEDL